MTQDKTAYTFALSLLARREYSVKQLKRRLSIKEYSTDIIDNVVMRLMQENAQSDERFTASYIHSRYHRGFGPIKILHELEQCGIDSELSRRYLAAPEYDWSVRAGQVWEKRFKGIWPKNSKEKSQHLRYLYYKGFDSHHIAVIFSTSPMKG